MPWGTRGVEHPADEKGNKTFEQIWFSGNHSDIGGSYPEIESRLSDIALEWMVNAATVIPHPIEIDRSVLRLYPSVDGMQHDECKVGFGLVTRWTGLTWSSRLRDLPHDTRNLHPSVLERFRLEEVQLHDVMAPYRPKNLADHDDVKSFY